MTSPLGKLFGRSPIQPIQEHMQLAQETVQLLCELLAASADQDWNRVAEIHSVIDSTTSDARKLRREIRQQLPRGLLLAMPRPDLLELLDIQNRITVCVREIARPVALRGMQFPKQLQTILDKHCSLLAATAGQALTAIRELDELITEGFGQRERKIMEKMLGSLERQVRRCDAQQQRLVRQLGKTEDSFPVLDAVFYYQIATALAQLADACGEVGEQLELLLAR
ncbi:DUF47 family protein [Congregibacter brevis]|uniref:DUF47 family protein n=1 Tax=Congregibacter brevis TaxID=3081201 RepID=A0ABZ0IE75_9GAMM|nr:DUF47 family protein [Congregibacter sp. IMCC45268]